MQALIEGGANLEARDEDGETALFMAIRNTKTAAVECLMKNGADPLAQSANKLVALDVARGLRTDYTEYARARDKIIKALTRDYMPQREASARPATPVEAPVAPVLTPATADDTPQDISVLKPLSLQPKRTGPGFNL
jgi:ankyrin repeat protein